MEIGYKSLPAAAVAESLHKTSGELVLQGTAISIFVEQHSKTSPSPHPCISVHVLASTQASLFGELLMSLLLYRSIC